MIISLFIGNGLMTNHIVRLWDYTLVWLPQSLHLYMLTEDYTFQKIQYLVWTGYIVAYTTPFVVFIVACTKKGILISRLLLENLR
jgi:hypothetical protein